MSSEAAPPPEHPPKPAEGQFVLRVGLTGGIATGKSTVGRIFTELGASVFDADDMAHRLIERGAPAYDEVVRAFGEAILRPDRSIDRKKLGGIVFADKARRAVLESILHPKIHAEQQRRISSLAESGQSRIAVTNAALLMETGYYRDYHRVVVSHCTTEIQIQRIRQRDDLSEAEARARIAAQMDAAEKLKIAHYVIDTSPGIAATEQRARVVFRHLQLDLESLGGQIFTL